MAEIPFLSNINLNQNELIFPRVHNLTAAPTTGNPTGAAVEGQLYMNTTSHKLFFYNGTTWVDTSATTYTWSLTADTGGTTSITDATTVDIAGGEGIATSISTSTVTVNLNIPGLSAPVGGVVDADSMVVYDASGAVHTEVTLSALKSYINAAAGTFSSFTITGDTGTDTITDAETITFAGGNGLVSTVSTGTVTYDLDFTTLVDKTTAIAGTTEFILNDAGTESRKAASEIGLQFFDNTTTAFTSNAGTVTSISAGNGMNFTTITSTGTITLGTPSSLTSSTTNSATGTTHTHAIDISGFASTVLSDSANIVYTNAARTISVTHTIATGSKLTLTDLPSAGTDAVNKNYVDSILASNDAMIFKGTIGTGGTLTIAAFNALTTYNTGWTYRVIEAGTIKGVVCEIGDMIVALVDRAVTGAVDADWTVVQTNLDGAVIGPASATDNAIALFDGTSGKLIKNSSVTLGTVGADAAVIRRKSQTCDGDTSTTVTHNFNTRNVIVQVYRTGTPYDMVMTEVKMTTVNTVDVNFNVAPTAGEYTIVVMG